MPTVAGLAASAAQLDREQLHELCRELQRLQKRFARPLRLKVEDVSYRLMLLDDAEWKSLLRRSLAVEDRDSLSVQLFLSLLESEAILRFVESFVVIAHRSGVGVRDGEEWKGGRLFRFALEVRRARRRFDYAFEYRKGEGVPSFYLWKVVEATDRRVGTGWTLAPIEEEFSRDEINDFYESFHYALLDWWESLSKRWRQPFVRPAPDLRLVFGYCEGRFFEELFASEDAYEAAYQRWEECVARAREAWGASR